MVSHLNAKPQNWQWAGIYFFQEKYRNVHRIAGLLIKCNSFAESPNLVQQTGPYSPSLLISCSVTPSDGFYGSNVQNGARDEYSAKVCGVPLARQWHGDEVGGDRGSVGIAFGDTVPRGYPDDVSGRLNICGYDTKRGSAAKEATEDTPQRQPRCDDRFHISVSTRSSSK